MWVQDRASLVCLKLRLLGNGWNGDDHTVRNIHSGNARLFRVQRGLFLRAVSFCPPAEAVSEPHPRLCPKLL